MRVTAIFEQWYIGDGTYPPLRKDDLVNLAFEMYPDVLRSSESDRTRLHHAGSALYEFTGIVLRHYRGANQTPVLLIESDGLRFYVSDGVAGREAFQPGQRVSGHGSLALDSLTVKKAKKRRKLM